MKKGTCLKCGGSEVYASKNGAQYSLGLSNTWRQLLEFENYLCMDCGYLETYFNFEPQVGKKEKHTEMYKKAMEERIAAIKDNWKKVIG